MITMQCNECGNTFNGNNEACPFCDSEHFDEYIEQLPYAKTIKGFIEALEIMSKYAESGPDTAYFLDAKHDIIYTYLTTDQLSPTSNDGRKLKSLGWFIDDDGWTTFT